MAICSTLLAFGALEGAASAFQYPPSQSASGSSTELFVAIFFRQFWVERSRSSGAKGGAKSYMLNGKMTGGYAVLASPVTYKRTGIMTFIVSKEGVVYQQDLGLETGELAAAIKDYNPTDGWTAAE
jgi:Protein of unknown function (DUF2950)